MNGPRYILHEQLGAGGMGVVYRGTMVTPVGRREVAIKRLAQQGDLDSRGRERLIAEAQLVFRLTHNNVCQVIDLGEGEQGTFVVLEYVRGCDLRGLIRHLHSQSRPLTVAAAVYIAREVARALDYAHRRTDDRGVALSLWHGDVTPQNTLLSIEGEVKLTDFGIARALGIVAPGFGLRGGTPGFVAPEAEHGTGDHRSDIYGLGVTLGVALTGRPPSELVGAPAALRRLRPDLSADLCEILARSLDVRPQQRFISAMDFDRALSLELARRDPAFTPSVLADLVRGCAAAATAASGTVDSAPSGKVTTIFSMVPSRQPPAAHTGSPRLHRTLTERRSLLAPSALRRWLPFALGGATSGTPRRPGALGLALAAAVSCAFILALAAVAMRGARRHAVESRSSATSETSRSPLPAAVASPKGQAAAPAPASTTPTDRSPLKDAAIATPPGRSRRSRKVVGKSSADAGYLTVTAAPWASVYVDGHRVADETPLYHYSLPSGDHRVRVRFQNEAPPSPLRKVHVEPGQALTLGFTR